MLEKLSINVGESTTIYIEIYDINTPEEELRYGDCKWDNNDKMVIWYGKDSNSEMSGWVDSPWNASNYTGAILMMAASSRSDDESVIYRVMNNDINFDEQKYLAIDMETGDE